MGSRQALNGPLAPSEGIGRRDQHRAVTTGATDTSKPRSRESQESREETKCGATQRQESKKKEPESMDRYAQDNRANQRNTNHTSTGSGRDAGYKGSPANKDNRANQLNPNHPSYAGKKKRNGPSSSD